MRFSAGSSSAVLIISAVIGYLSAVQTIGRAGQLPNPSDAKWQRSGVDLADRYSLYGLAHFIQDGILPPPKSAEVYTRSTDDEGNTLRGSCSYQLSGTAPASRWWSVNLGATPSEKSKSFTSGDAILNGDESFALHLSPRALPGNWLPTGDLGNMYLSLVVNERYAQTKSDKPSALPTLKKLGCD